MAYLVLASLVQFVRREPAVALTQTVLILLETVPVASVLTVLTTAVYWVGRMVGGALATRQRMVAQSMIGIVFAQHFRAILGLRL